MSDAPKYRVMETTAMGETWWNVVDNSVPDSEVDGRYVYGSFSKDKRHAEIFCTLMNLEGRECRNEGNV